MVKLDTHHAACSRLLYTMKSYEAQSINIYRLHQSVKWLPACEQLVTCVGINILNACDNIRPICGSCRRGKSNCHWDKEFRFHHDFNLSVLDWGGNRSNLFRESQKWLSLPKTLQFVDETKDLEALYGFETTENDSALPHLVDNSVLSTAFARNSPSLPSKASRNAIFSDILLAPDEFASFPSQSKTTDSDSHLYATTRKAKKVGADSLDAPCLHLRDAESLRPKLRTAQEARLMRHFVDCLSSWFDIFDRSRNFAIVAPLRALTNSTLRNAIYAASARHLSLTSDVDPLVADHFHQQCLRTLIPVLNDPAALLDEELFAAAVILRLFEELDGPTEPLFETERQSHLLGVQVLLDAKDYTEVTQGLGQAAFKVALRQEISIAFKHQRPILASLVLYDVDLTSSPTSEDTWGYRSSIFLAWVLQFCHGSETKSYQRWRKLVDHYDWWLQHRPHAFEPFYVRHIDEAVPSIFYWGNVHVLTANHYTLARIMLAVYEMSQLDAERKHAIDKQARELVYELCGVALSNPTVTVAFLSASAGIAICADKFPDQKDQTFLLEFLTSMQRQHGYSTVSAQQRLQRNPGLVRTEEKMKTV